MIRYLINTYHNFYPRSPYGERLDGSKSSIEEVSFLSTLSLRRATYWSCVPVVGRSFLSTLSLRRATCYCSGRATSHRPFLSTLSLRRATSSVLILSSPYIFLSTLSLRRATTASASFPTFPAFLSTLSLRRATILRRKRRIKAKISIHALLTESD